MRGWIGVGLLLALAGCAGNPPSRSYLAMSGMLEAGTMQKQYRADLESADFAPIRDKVDLAETFESGLPACGDSKLDGYPGPGEQAALRQWRDLRTAYLIGLDALQTRPGQSAAVTAPAAWRYAEILAEGRRRSSQMISDLADGKMTYCQFAARDRALPYVDARREKPYPPEMVEMLMAIDAAERAARFAPSLPNPPSGPGATAVIQSTVGVSQGGNIQH